MTGATILPDEGQPRVRQRLRGLGPLVWLPVPPHLDTAGRRSVAFARSQPVSILAHLVNIGLFVWWGIGPLVAVTAVGSAVWLLALLLAHRGEIGWNYALTIGVGVVEVAATVLLVGWGFGAQYFLLVLMLAMIDSPWPTRVRAAGAAALTALFAIGYVHTQFASPVYHVPPIQLLAMHTLNVGLTFALCALAVADPVTATEEAEEALAAEHARSERLLTNVLPAAVAVRLKRGDAVVADSYDQASVLFADIVGFTPASAARSAAATVGWLDQFFTMVDELVDEFALEKIKTIGDAYMVAAGVPTPRADHAQVLARFALRLRDSTTPSNADPDAVLLRIGISSGPVVAGVIGRRRLLYDLWGDTVNTASRMESHGVPGQIQISPTTRDLLGDGFTYLERGPIEVKGKGRLTTYLLNSQNPPQRAKAHPQTSRRG